MVNSWLEKLNLTKLWRVNSPALTHPAKGVARYARGDTLSSVPSTSPRVKRPNTASVTLGID